MIHTPGPWELCDRGAYTDFDGNSRVICGDDIRIAVVHCTGNKETEANGRLIATAPELLEALKEVFKYMSGENGRRPMTWGIHSKVQAAIAKAEGK